MTKLELTIPALYGDHHTVAVREIVKKIEGVTDVFASAAAHYLSVTYDPKKVKPEAVIAALAEQGYESGVPEPVYIPSLGERERSWRQSDLYAGTSGAMAFSEQTLVRDGRPLWPCPGFDVRSPHKVA